MDVLPNKKTLMNSIIIVLQKHNCIMTTSDINNDVASYLNLSEELLQIEDSNCTGTEFSYRMRWARTELKQKGKIINVKKGQWKLAE